jgi:hypothetical protein
MPQVNQFRSNQHFCDLLALPVKDQGVFSAPQYLIGEKDRRLDGQTRITHLSRQRAEG